MAARLAQSVKRNIVWIVLMGIVVFAVYRPQERFEPTQLESVAIDRQTGKLCRTTDANHNTSMPLCTDLVKWWQR